MERSEHSQQGGKVNYAVRLTPQRDAEHQNVLKILAPTLNTKLTSVLGIVYPASF